MALFKKKAPEGGEETPSDDDGFQSQPEKAQKWFDHAKSMADRYTYESALFYYANGVKLDPEVMSAHEAMYEAAIQYANRGGKPAQAKDIRKLDGPHVIEKFVAAEYAWMKDISNFSLAMKFLSAAVKAKQYEVARWHAPFILNLQLKQKKQSKGSLVQAKDLFAEVGAWDQAIIAGEAAVRVDPTDANLEAEIKDLAAQRVMDQGGYEEAAQSEGGFRTMVKDLDKQQELVEAEALSGAGSSEERVLARAAEEFRQHPNSPEAINKYAQLLKKQGTDESISNAHDVYMQGYESSKEYRFRMLAGDIDIGKLRKKANKCREALEQSPDDEQLQSEYEHARQQQIALQETEYKERVAKYPTDRHMKYALGEVYYDQDKHDDAMACFQAAKDEPKLRVRAGHMLGRCFAAQGWHMDASAEFDEALSKIEAGERERENAIRYDLMDSQFEHAREERSVELARDARENCSTIARRDITFRDIRRKRSEIESLIKELDGRA